MDDGRHKTANVRTKYHRRKSIENRIKHLFRIECSLFGLVDLLTSGSGLNINMNHCKYFFVLM